MNPNRIQQVGKRIPSRERIDELHRIALVVDAEDADILRQTADLLLDMRQAHRGGRKHIPGGRHWNDDNERGA